MDSRIKNILIVVGAVIVGNMVNMGFILLGSALVALPAGIDPNDMNSYVENAHLLEARHFIFPFLAHFMGTLVAAWIVAKYTSDRWFFRAMFIGVIFLVFGVINIMMIKPPMWMNVIDVLFAYIPAAWLGWKLSGKNG